MRLPDASSERLDAVDSEVPAPKAIASKSSSEPRSPFEFACRTFTEPC
jgi:hypothetical protein